MFKTRMEPLEWENAEQLSVDNALRSGGEDWAEEKEKRALAGVEKALLLTFEA